MILNQYLHLSYLFTKKRVVFTVYTCSSILWRRRWEEDRFIENSYHIDKRKQKLL